MDGWTRNGKEEKCSHTHTHVNFNRAINPGRHTDTLAFPAVTGTTQMLPAGSHGSSVKRAHDIALRTKCSREFLQARFSIAKNAASAEGPSNTALPFRQPNLIGDSFLLLLVLGWEGFSFFFKQGCRFSVYICPWIFPWTDGC